MRSAPALKIWMTPLASVAILEKLALSKIARCSAPTLSSACCPLAASVDAGCAPSVGPLMASEVIVELHDAARVLHRPFHRHLLDGGRYTRRIRQAARPKRTIRTVQLTMRCQARTASRRRETRVY